jgi:hypothetical protein
MSLCDELVDTGAVHAHLPCGIRGGLGWMAWRPVAEAVLDSIPPNTCKNEKGEWVRMRTVSGFATYPDGTCKWSFDRAPDAKLVYTEVSDGG